MKHHLRRGVWWIVSTWFAACGCAPVACAAAPNIILIVADDAAYGDYGFSATINGGTTANETPNLDALAQRSLIASQAYNAAPVCGPSRAGLLTGQYQQRYGYEENLSSSAAASGTWGLSEAQVTIPERLQNLGYTTGAIGKWHSGYADGLNRPLDKGFDEFYGFLGGGRTYWTVGGLEKGIRKNNSSYENQYRVQGDPAKYDPVKGRYLTDAFGEEAVSYVNRHAGDEQPFFLYLAFTAPHTPHEAKQVDLDRFAHIADPSERARAAMIYAMDRSIGEVLGSLEANGIDENTMVVFMNDNGAPSIYGSNPPLRGHKGTTWEGGIRTPMLFSGPGLQPGRYDAPITAYDLLPTFVAAGGGDVTQFETDGYNVMPQLTGEAADNPHEIMFWRHFTAWAVRKGDWKLAAATTTTTTPALYNLSLDPSERTSYNAQHRDVEAELLSELTHWEATMAKPRWGALSANTQNQFDHFVFRSELNAASNWSTAGNWHASGATTSASLKPADAYANAILEFTTRDGADYRATNDMKRMSRQTFMLNQVRLTGAFAGGANRRGTIDGNAVLMVKSLTGQLPEIRFEATSSGTAAQFGFQWDNEIQLLDDLQISGNGTQEFVINGRIRDYYEPGAAEDASITVPHHVKKLGTSQVTLAGDNTFGGNLTVEGGTVVVRGASAAIRGVQQIVIGSAGRLTLESGTISVQTLDNSAGGTFDFHGGTLNVVDVAGDLQNQGGTFAPGISPALSTVSGSYTQTAGVLQIEIGGPTAGEQFDRLMIGGTASLAGTLDIRLTSGYVPSLGQSFEFLSSGGIDGMFTDALFPTLPSELAWRVRHNLDSVSLVVELPTASTEPVGGDYNDDGMADAADYTVWRNSVGLEGSDLAADGNGDRVVNEADYVVWKSSYGNLSPTRGGDFNGDGLVDAADYTVWRNSFGELGSLMAADGNGDNRIGEADYTVWASHYGAISPSRFGDYNHDGEVDAADYTVWRNSQGRTGPGLAADGNGDLRVDEDDYVFWTSKYGTILHDGGSGGLALAGTVPEPATIVSFVISCILGAATCRRR